MVEGALVILPLIAIGFALFDYSLAIFIQNTLRNAVREGVRYAITQQTGAGGQDAAITNVVEMNSMGFLNSSNVGTDSSPATITVQYYSPSTLTQVTGTGSNGAGNICVVTATIQHGWMAPVWRSSGVMTFTASSSDVMESPPGGVLPTR